MNILWIKLKSPIHILTGISNVRSYMYIHISLHEQYVVFFCFVCRGYFKFYTILYCTYCSAPYLYFNIISSIHIIHTHTHTICVNYQILLSFTLQNNTIR